MALSRKKLKDAQTLPKKMQDVFDKKLLKCYENEKLEAAIKEADTILREHPRHGETLVMKGLCFHTIAIAERDTAKKAGDPLGREGDSTQLAPLLDEAKKEDLLAKGLSLIQAGLKHNMASSMCWRVKGVAHKSQGQLQTAIRCYKQALRCKGVDSDKNTRHRILSEMASLQLQLHLWKDYAQTRFELYNFNPTDKVTTIQYLCALYFAGEFRKGYLFIDSSVLVQHTFTPVAFSEILLLRAMFLFGAGEFDACIKFMDEKLEAKLIRDRLSVLRLKKKLYAKQSDTGKQIATLKELLFITSEHSTLYTELLQLIGFWQVGDDGTDKEADYSKYDEVKAVLEEIQRVNPRCSAIKRLTLTITPASDARFRTVLHEYMSSKLMRSVMSLYKDLKSLYKEPAKAAIMDELIEEYMLNLPMNAERTDGVKFLASDKFLSAAPSCLIWLYYFRASRNLDVLRFEEALADVNAALSLFPTSADLNELKGRVYKYSGNAKEAYFWMNESRELDLADRFLNTKCVRYALRNGLPEIAGDLVKLFIRRSEGDKILQTLEVLWYELHKAECHLQATAPPQYGPGLRNYEWVFEHFAQFHENALYFHKYSCRNGFIRSALDVVRWDEKMNAHPLFRRGCRGAVLGWLRLLAAKKEPLKTAATSKTAADGSSATVVPPPPPLWHKGSSAMHASDKKKDTSSDPRGWELIHLKKPLTEASKWLALLFTVESNTSSGDSLFGHALNVLVEGHSQQFAADELQQRIRDAYPGYKKPKPRHAQKAFGSIVRGSEILKQRFALTATAATQSTDVGSDGFSKLFDEAEFVFQSVEFLQRVETGSVELDADATSELEITQSVASECDPYVLSTLPFARKALFGAFADDASVATLPDVVKAYAKHCATLNQFAAVLRLSALLGLDIDECGLIGSVKTAPLKECVVVFKKLQKEFPATAAKLATVCQKKFPLSSVFA